jgi:hypothetical protein
MELDDVDEELRHAVLPWRYPAGTDEQRHEFEMVSTYGLRARGREGVVVGVVDGVLGVRCAHLVDVFEECGACRESLR